MDQGDFQEQNDDVNEINDELIESYPVIDGSPFFTLSTDEISSKKPIVFVVTGNLAVASFYADMVCHLRFLMGNKANIIVPTHAGHSRLPDGLNMPKGFSTGLEAQVEIKVKLLRHLVSISPSPLILVGHSIGCYMILEIMRRYPEIKIDKSILLFPTIELLSQSPRGRLVTPILKYFRWLIVLLSWFISALEDWVIVKIARFYFRSRDISPTCLRSIPRMFTASSIRHMMDMAHEEMQLVSTQYDTKSLDHLQSKLVFLYGLADHWCPVAYGHFMKDRLPHANVVFDDKKLDHDFPLYLAQSTAVSEFVWKWIKDFFQ